jgi:hypothetical protein
MKSIAFFIGHKNSSLKQFKDNPEKVQKCTSTYVQLINRSNDSKKKLRFLITCLQKIFTAMECGTWRILRRRRSKNSATTGLGEYGDGEGSGRRRGKLSTECGQEGGGAVELRMGEETQPKSCS